jgi:hypothetical protein
MTTPLTDLAPFAVLPWLKLSWTLGRQESISLDDD